MYLNFVGNRSFNDLTQYPVFPWVIADYKNDKIDFDAAKNA
jgi:factor associated with neutral sphingomyelinase activation